LVQTQLKIGSPTSVTLLTGSDSSQQKIQIKKGTPMKQNSEVV